MLVVANGAFKSGSSWLYRIIKLITNFDPIPSEYQNPKWRHPSIDPDLLEQFLTEQDYATCDFLCKNHFRTIQQRNTLLSHSDVFVFGIERDLRDVVVSSYYHYQKHEGYDKSFEEYYWARGRSVAKAVGGYNTKWGSVSSSRLFVTRYEHLLGNFDEEVSKIAEVLKLDLSADRLSAIEHDTNFQNWKAKTGSKNLRKGIIGDWKNHLDDRMLEDIAEIELSQHNTITTNP